MNSSPRPRFIALAIAGSAALPQFVLGGGISLYEVATLDVGLAAAGYAARAQDASTLFRNPAGMSLLEGTQLEGGLQVTYGDVAFSKAGSPSSL